MPKRSVNHRKRLVAHRLPVCAATGKVRFRDKHQAHDALKEASRRRQEDAFLGLESPRRECRVYRCEACTGWHLTSWADPARPAPSPPTAPPRVSAPLGLPALLPTLRVDPSGIPAALRGPRLLPA